MTSERAVEPREALRSALAAHTPQVRNGPFIVCSCGWEHDDGDGDQWREHILAASPAPDPGAGLRDAAQAVVDSVHGVQYGTSTPRLPVTAESPVHWQVSGAAIDALRVALAPSAEPPETT